jgi:hypothetical protein
MEGIKALENGDFEQVALQSVLLALVNQERVSWLQLAKFRRNPSLVAF